MTETGFRLKRHLASFQIMILGFAGVILLGALVPGEYTTLKKCFRL